MTIAEELAKEQKKISVAEFFEKNRQILGFDSGSRALITSVKEAVDNALDACEESDILPDILVRIDKVEAADYKITVEDNGPGIVKEEIPKIFGTLLYGSRFHINKQSRGQQGIGISAAVLYSQLSTGKATKIISKTGPENPANQYKVTIDTSKNEPKIIKEKEIEWSRPQGTRIEIFMQGRYVRARKQSIYNYIKETGIVNPHARLTLIEPDGKKEVFKRAVDELPPEPKEIKPHPLGIELGTLMKMLKGTDSYKLFGFLTSEFTRLGKKTAQKICEESGLGKDRRPGKLSREEAKKLLKSFEQVKLVSPPVDCLSPITEKSIRKGLEKEYPGAELISTTTRSPEVHGGNPFVVETGIAYGGEIEKEGRINIQRYANRTPLLYKRGACAMTKALKKINWRRYGLNQKGGKGIPEGPAVVLIHLASTNVPYTSESKDAVANISEIKNEVERALREVARVLKKHVKRREKRQKRRRKEKAIKKVLPKIAEKAANITGKEKPKIDPVVAKIMRSLIVSKKFEEMGSKNVVKLKIKNFDSKKHEFDLKFSSEKKAVSAPDASIRKKDSKYEHTWSVSIKSKDEEKIEFIAEKDGEISVSGVKKEELVLHG